MLPLIIYKFIQTAAGVLKKRPAADLTKMCIRDSINGVGGKGKVHLGNDHGRIHGDNDGVGTDLVASGSGDADGAYAHSLHDTGVAHGQNGTIVRDLSLIHISGGTVRIHGGPVHCGSEQVGMGLCLGCLLYTSRCV